VTYSIVARCPDTGRFGVAVHSHFFSVGSVVPWLASGVGAVATQATAEIAHGPNGLRRLRAGDPAPVALRRILADDEEAKVRQVAMVDTDGLVGVHTGSSCIDHAGHVVGDGFAVQANMMRDPGVPEAMADAFTTASGSLAYRMLEALDAAEAAGGDIRGRQSASLAVVEGMADVDPGHDRVLDVRVEDHPDPLAELHRLVRLGSAYRAMEDAEGALGAGELDAALAVYERCAAAHPDQPEFPFWQAVVLASLGRLDEARAVMAPVLAGPRGDGWRELVGRLPDAGLLAPDLVEPLLR
jgi:uncharacterized Ntn-hydrolase superfamily protein